MYISNQAFVTYHQTMPSGGSFAISNSSNITLTNIENPTTKIYLSDQLQPRRNTINTSRRINWLILLIYLLA